MWTDGEFRYSIFLLEAIAINYQRLYADGIHFLHRAILNPFSIAEYKADFDQALDTLSKRQRRAVTSQVDDIPDSTLEQEYYDVRKTRRGAYRDMARFLNYG